MISVIVVNWNSGDQLFNCVVSIVEHSKNLVAEIIVVDNGSIDCSIAAIATMPKVHVIRNGSNQGFGRACNLGAQQAKSRYLLFLNPDALLFSDTLSKALVYMNTPLNSKVGICGVQLLNEDGCISRHCARFPTAHGFFVHALGVDRICPRLGHFMAEWDHTTTRQVNQIIGAFFLVRRELFETLGGFDERFFVYFEEVDFSYRAFDAGWKSVYLADAQAFHAGNGTTKHIKARRLFYSWRSRLVYVLKHFSWAGALVVLFATLLIEPVSRSGLALMRRSWPNLKETWAAYGMLWRWLPQWVLKGETR